MIFLLTNIFVIALLLNLIYEVLHSVLYKTCLEASFKKYLYLITKACIFDAFSITIIYYLSYLIFRNKNVFENPLQLTAFSLTALMFAYFWETYSLKKGKWKYSKTMPLILGVGATPLIQLFLTGILSFYIIFK